MNKTVTITQVKEALKTKQATLLDVRESGEFLAGHIPGSRNVPLSLLPFLLQDLDREITYYLVCQSGARSQRAAQVMASQGFQVANVLGGIETWDQALEHGPVS